MKTDKINPADNRKCDCGSNTLVLAAGELQSLYAQSYRSRNFILQMSCRAGKGHIGADFSCIDILTVLYFKVLRIRPDDPTWVERDRFILSKGHAAGALYVTLAARGFFPESWLDSYQELDSNLPGHPDRSRLSGIEHSTGSLGHGLPVGTGLAAGLRMKAERESAVPRVFVLLGDGELQEGSNWEAAMLGSHLQLNNLIAIVDRNGLQQGNCTESTVRLENLSAKWESFGWNVFRCNGHDMEQLIWAFSSDKESDKPRVIIAETVKGRGVSFMENNPAWHHKVPSAEEQRLAQEEIMQTLTAIEGNEPGWQTFVQRSQRL